VFAERRTLPSSTAPTFSLRAIVPMSVFVHLNENAEVRAATCNSGRLRRRKMGHFGPIPWPSLKR
jgi:hypothetical protein